MDTIDALFNPGSSLWCLRWNVLACFSAAVSEWERWVLAADPRNSTTAQQPI